MHVLYPYVFHIAQYQFKKRQNQSSQTSFVLDHRVTHANTQTQALACPSWIFSFSPPTPHPRRFPLLEFPAIFSHVCAQFPRLRLINSSTLESLPSGLSFSLCLSLSQAFPSFLNLCLSILLYFLSFSNNILNSVKL